MFSNKLFFGEMGFGASKRPVILAPLESWGSMYIYIYTSMYQHLPRGAVLKP